jgi:hypothetical protein
MHRPSRRYRPDAKGRQRSLDAAVQSVRETFEATVGAGKSAHVWVDGNIAAEDLAAAKAFCDGVGDKARLLVHLPPHDRGVAEGLDAAGVEQSPPSSWREADAVVVIGNPFATHPPVARELMRWGAERAKTLLVVIDSSAGLLSTYTPDHFVCRPGYEYWVVAALLDPASNEAMSVLASSGIDTGRLKNAAGRLRDAKRPAVVVAPQSGGADRWRALTSVAAKWCKGHGGGMSILTGHANAVAVSRYMHRHGIEDWVSVCAGGGFGDVGALLVVGFDPSCAYPRRMWEGPAQQAELVVMASAYPPVDEEWVDEVIPLALGSEAGGTYILADGKTHAVEPVCAAPSGVPTVRGLFSRLAGALGEGPGVSEADVSPAPGDAPAPARPSQEASNGWPAVLIADPAAYFDGQMSRHAAWVQQMHALPELWISPVDARSLGVDDGQTVKVRNAQGAADVQVIYAHHQPEFGGCFAEIRTGDRVSGWVAVNGSRAEIRQLASWDFAAPDEAALAGTIQLEIEVPASAGAQQE